MEPTILFTIANSVAMLGWLAMAFFYDKSITYKIVFNGLVVLLCILYASVIVWSFSEPTQEGNFSSLEGVMALFSNPKAVLAGWVHYLAFDMLTGLFIVYHSSKNRISRWLILPCLFFTFMLGPVGWLMYYGLLAIHKKSILPDYH
ncbi:MAG: DUF4281 domain-containing protein [Bacteroidetes bacterium]|nr:DUF4281 domain-containing protein [Bacteroidota bacterium]MBK8659497.1 DUF4281 domain-containing protein [Bacteroidota bacterium]